MTRSPADQGLTEHSVGHGERINLQLKQKVVEYSRITSAPPCGLHSDHCSLTMPTYGRRSVNGKDTWGYMEKIE